MAAFSWQKITWLHNLDDSSESEVVAILLVSQNCWSPVFGIDLRMPANRVVSLSLWSVLCAGNLGSNLLWQNNLALLDSFWLLWLGLTDFVLSTSRDYLFFLVIDSRSLALMSLMFLLAACHLQHGVQYRTTMPPHGYMPVPIYWTKMNVIIEYNYRSILHFDLPRYTSTLHRINITIVPIQRHEHFQRRLTREAVMNVGSKVEHSHWNTICT